MTDRLSAISSLAGQAAVKAGQGGSGSSRGSGGRVVVVGAGAFGCWTALHLRKLGADVTLLDAWGAGNSRSSSGGVTRVMRAIYGPDRIYTEMVARSFELWRELESATGHQLYTPTGALWMLRGEDDAYLRAALPICAELGFPIDQPSLEEARRRWPQINFEGIEKLYFERRAGMLSARRSCRTLKQLLVDSGAQYRIARARIPDPDKSRISELELEDGASLAADAFVFTCGPWLGRLFPDLIGEHVQASRQDVFFFGTPPGSEQFGTSRFPAWIDFGERIFYGLPDAHGHGFKLADDTRGSLVNPTTMDRQPDPEALARGRRFIAHRFPAMTDAPLIESRVCQYENSPDGHLIVDRHPGIENVWIAGGGSGHGFKLSPSLGEQVAGAVLGRSEPYPGFALKRLASEVPRATQFQSEEG